MINVLGFVRDIAALDGPTYYRVYLPLREVGRKVSDVNAAIVDGKSLQGHSDGDLPPFDVVVMARMYHGDCAGFIAEIHRRGGVLVLDSDDDLTETYRLVSGRGEEFKEVLGLVDYVSTSTQPLADLFGEYTQRPPVVLQNHVDAEWMRVTAARGRRITEGLTIGFSGSPTHWRDWQLPSVPFARVLRDFNVTGILHGECPRYLDFAGEVIKLAGVPMEIYPLLLSQFDLLLCAVDATDEFNAGKSAVKALEAMSIGVVPICSRFQPYVDLYEAGAPVVLVEEDSQDGWYTAMRWLIENEFLLQKLSAAGPGWVAENRDMGRTGYKKWREFYQEISLWGS